MNKKSDLWTFHCQNLPRNRTLRSRLGLGFDTALSKFKVAWGEVGGDPQTAMELGEEQFRLCAELSFQPGLVAYVALHCVEAASLAVANRHEIQNETEEHRVAFQWKHILLEFWLEKRTEIPF